MNSVRAFVFTCCLVLPVHAIVIRHDVSDSRYLVHASVFPPLAELPDEGQGVLIANRWVVTAAHAVYGRSIQDVRINGRSYPVSEVMIHPGYKMTPSELTSGDSAPLMVFKASSDDIALVELKSPVSEVAPAKMYRGSDEADKTAEILGRGATGNGLTGQYPESPHRGELRRAYSRVVSAKGRWLTLKFEAPPHALPFEGSPSDGDSGGPILIKSNHIWELAGLVSHKYASGNLATYHFAHYGQITYQARVSYYLPWIEATMKSLGASR